MRKKTDSIYPYTYACDLIRSAVGYNETPPLGTKLSRSDAAKIYSMFAAALNMDSEEFAKKLADYYLEHQLQIDNTSLEEFLRTLEAPDANHG